jgi:hypothetical protein
MEILKTDIYFSINILQKSDISILNNNITTHIFFDSILEKKAQLPNEPLVSNEPLVPIGSFAPSIGSSTPLAKYPKEFIESLDKSYNININEYIEQINKSKDIIEFNKKLKLPNKILYIYCLLDSLDREFIYSNFIFISINNIIEQYNLYVFNNQTKICDIAITYLGLGYIIILTYDITTNRFFFRYDGDSNDSDIKFSYEFIKNYNLEYNKTYDLQETFDIIHKIDGFIGCIN